MSQLRLKHLLLFLKDDKVDEVSSHNLDLTEFWLFSAHVLLAFLDWVTGGVETHSARPQTAWTLLTPRPQTHITWMQRYIIHSPRWTHNADLLSRLGPLLVSLIPQNADVSLKTDGNSKLPLCLHAWDSPPCSFSLSLYLIFSPNFLFSHFWIISLNSLTQLWAMMEPLREFWPAESLHYHYWGSSEKGSW